MKNKNTSPFLHDFVWSFPQAIKKIELFARSLRQSRLFSPVSYSCAGYSMGLVSVAYVGLSALCFFSDRLPGCISSRARFLSVSFYRGRFRRCYYYLITGGFPCQQFRPRLYRLFPPLRRQTGKIRPIFPYFARFSWPPDSLFSSRCPNTACALLGPS